MIPNNQFWFNNKTGYGPIETGWEYVASGVNYNPAFTERDGDVIFEVGGNLRMVGGWDPAQFKQTLTDILEFINYGRC